MREYMQEETISSSNENDTELSNENDVGENEPAGHEGVSGEEEENQNESDQDAHDQDEKEEEDMEQEEEEDEDDDYDEEEDSDEEDQSEKIKQAETGNRIEENKKDATENQSSSLLSSLTSGGENISGVDLWNNGDSADESDEAAFQEILLRARSHSELKVAVRENILDPMPMMNEPSDLLLNQPAYDHSINTKDNSDENTLQAVVAESSSKDVLLDDAEVAAAAAREAAQSRGVDKEEQVRSGSSESVKLEDKERLVSSGDSDHSKSKNKKKTSPSRPLMHSSPAQVPHSSSKGYTSPSEEKKRGRRSMSKKFFRGNRKDHRRRSTLLASLLESSGDKDPFGSSLDATNKGSGGTEEQWAKVRVLMEQKKKLTADIEMWKKRVEEQKKENHALTVKIWRGGKKKRGASKRKGAYSFGDVLLPFMSTSQVSVPTGIQERQAEEEMEKSSSNHVVNFDLPKEKDASSSSAKEEGFQGEETKKVTDPGETETQADQAKEEKHPTFSQASHPEEGIHGEESKTEAGETETEEGLAEKVEGKEEPPSQGTLDSQGNNGEEEDEDEDEEEEDADDKLLASDFDSANSMDESDRLDSSSLQRQRSFVLRDLLSLEHAYAVQLDEVIDRALLPARSLETDIPLAEEDVKCLFGEIEVLRGYNTLMKSELTRRLNDGLLSSRNSSQASSNSEDDRSPKDVPRLADLFDAADGICSTYARYICGLPEAIGILSKYEALKNQLVAAWFASRLETTSLQYLLLRPVLQLWKYHLAMHQYADASPTSHVDRKLHRRVLARLDAAVLKCSLAMKKADASLEETAALLQAHESVSYYDPSPSLSTRLLYQSRPRALLAYSTSKKRTLSKGRRLDALLTSECLLLLRRRSRRSVAKCVRNLPLVQIVRVVDEASLLATVVPDPQAMYEAIGDYSDGESSRSSSVDMIPSAAALGPGSGGSSHSQSHSSGSFVEIPTTWWESLFAVVTLGETIVIHAGRPERKKKWCTFLRPSTSAALI